MIRKYTKKALEKRKEERKDYPAFFQKHVQAIFYNREKCAECGCRLKGDVSEVAHILPKQTFKSIATDDYNVIYLCGWRSENNCHSKFDDGTDEQVQNMKIYSEVREKVIKLEEKITEKINFKFYDKWQI